MVIQAGWQPLLHAAPHLSLSPLLQGGARRLLTKRQLATLSRRAGRQLSAKQLEGLDDEEELDDFLAEDDKSMYMVRTIASTMAVTPPGTQPADRKNVEDLDRPHQLRVGLLAQAVLRNCCSCTWPGLSRRAAVSSIWRPPPQFLPANVALANSFYANILQLQATLASLPLAAAA